MSSLIALTAFAGLAASVSAQACTSLGDAAAAAGLTSLAATIAGVASLDDAEGLLAAVNADTPLEERVTVFAPTNAAFAAISDTVNGLSQEEILDVLLNHVVADDLPEVSVIGAITDTIPPPAKLTTLLDEIVEARRVNGSIILTPEGTNIRSRVTATDLMTCAGVVHVIDAVLVPAADGAGSGAGAGGAGGAGAGGAAQETCVSVADAAADAGLTTLAATVASVAMVNGSQGLSGVIAATTPQDQKVTIFAPTNAAFDEISTTLTGLSSEEVLDVLLNHVVTTELDLAAVNAAVANNATAILPTLLNITLEASSEGDDVIITPSATNITAKVVVTDVMTCAGVVHVIDKVLVPSPDAVPVVPANTTSGPCMSVEDVATARNLTALLDSVDMVSMLPEASDIIDVFTATNSTATKVTIFVPTDAAFAAIGDVAAALTEEQLLDVLSNHVITGDLKAAAAAEAIRAAAPSAAQLETFADETLEATLSGNEIFLMPTGSAVMARVVQTDIATCAGTIHLIDMVLVPAAEVPELGTGAQPLPRDGATQNPINTGTTVIPDNNSGAGYALPAASALVAIAGAAMLMV